MIIIVKRLGKLCLVTFVIAFLAYFSDGSFLMIAGISFLANFYLRQKVYLAFLSGILGLILLSFALLLNNNFSVDNLFQITFTIRNKIANKDFVSQAITLGAVAGLASIFRYSKIERKITNSMTPVILDAIIFFPILFVLSYLSRLKKNKPIDVGLGPQPLINNVYHKQALILAGYSAETFVENVYFITQEFDYRGDLSFLGRSKQFNRFANIALFIRALFRYKSIFIYFNGGPLRVYPILKYVEPYFLNWASVKILVMPYGGDVNDMHFGPNYKFKHALCTDYPLFHRQNKNTAEQIIRWTENADFVISGCDWVDYTYHWDLLMMAHFSIDVSKIESLELKYSELVDSFSVSRPLRIFHAPNHKTIKGSKFVQQAIAELKEEGYPIELIMVQGKPNDEVLKLIAQCDLVLDQLVIGWYAMFALEGLSMGKPVICYLREDLIELFHFSGALESISELPFLNTKFSEIKSSLRDILEGKLKLKEYADKALPYVKKYHSVEALSTIFKTANERMKVFPVTKHTKKTV